MRDDVAVRVFARAPRPGFTKTRLIPSVGAEGAARLSGAFLDDTLATLMELATDLELYAAAEPDAAILEGRHPDLPVRVQHGADLGERLTGAMVRSLRSAAAVLIVGSDAPTLPRAHLSRALAALRDGVELVLGPSADGGFTAIGVREPLDLRAVRWSSRHTLSDTLEASAGRTSLLLPPWYDVDTAEDLQLLRAHLNVRADLAPHTRVALTLRGADTRMRFDPAAEPE